MDLTKELSPEAASHMTSAFVLIESAIATLAKENKQLKAENAKLRRQLSKESVSEQPPEKPLLKKEEAEDLETLGAELMEKAATPKRSKK